MGMAKSGICLGGFLWPLFVAGPSYAYSIGYNWYVASNSRRPSRLKLVQGTHDESLLPVSTEIRRVQGVTTLWALVYRALDRRSTKTTGID